MKKEVSIGKKNGNKQGKIIRKSVKKWKMNMEKRQYGNKKRNK